MGMFKPLQSRVDAWISQFEEGYFHPQRIADRILGMGDIVSLVERAAATIDAEKAARVAEKMRKGKFDLADMRDQLMLEILLDIRDLFAVAPAAKAGSTALEKLEALRRLAKK